MSYDPTSIFGKKPKFKHPSCPRTQQHCVAWDNYRAAHGILAAAAGRYISQDPDILLQAAIDFATARNECEELGMLEKPRQDLRLVAEEAKHVYIEAKFSEDTFAICAQIVLSNRAEAMIPNVESLRMEIGRLASLAVERVFKRLRGV